MEWWVYLILGIIAVILVILVVLFIVGNKLQKRQLAQKEQMDAMAQTMSMLIIDKKKMPLREANLPDMVLEQTPKYLRRSKMPFVKAKIGPRVMTLIADPQVFELIPVKKEIKAVVSGIYITKILSVRGGSIVVPPKKKGFFSRFQKKKKNDAPADTGKSSKR